jgi:hypothetical protein
MAASEGRNGKSLVLGRKEMTTIDASDTKTLGKSY